MPGHKTRKTQSQKNSQAMRTANNKEKRANTHKIKHPNDIGKKSK